MRDLNIYIANCYFLEGKKQDSLPNNSYLESVGLTTDKVVDYLTKGSLIYWLGWKGLALGSGAYVVGNVLVGKYKNWLEIDNIQLLLAYTDLEYKLFSQFHLSAEQRFNKLFSERPEIFNQVPLKYIASSLGITPETLSRLRKNHLK